MSVYDEIRAERESHALRGYDSQHDKAHGPGHLVSWAFSYADGYRPGSSAPQVRSRSDLIKAASLLVAAIELLDEVEGRAVLRQPIDAEGA